MDLRNKTIVFRVNIFALIFLSSCLSATYSQSIGVNNTGSTPNSKALLDINSDNTTGTKKGLLIPRLTTTERNALSAGGSTPESLLIYNTTTTCYEAWNQSTTAWVVAFGCINCHPPGPFTVNEVARVGPTFFDASWTASIGANGYMGTGETGYFLDVSTSNTFSSFVPGYNNRSVGNVLAFRVTGLANSTTYYYRVRAVNACGSTLNTNTISVTTKVQHTCTSQTESDYETVVTNISGTNRTWITRNLGAIAEATSFIDTSFTSVGCFFQFNRSQAYRNYPHDGWMTVSPAWPQLAWGNLTAINENSDWLLANDPCNLQLGGSWRLPTLTEYQSVATYLNTNMSGFTGDDFFSTDLKWYYSSSLQYWNGCYTFDIANSNYPADITVFNDFSFWNSTSLDSTTGGTIRFGLAWTPPNVVIAYTNGAGPAMGNKVEGYQVRCLK